MSYKTQVPRVQDHFRESQTKNQKPPNPSSHSQMSQLLQLLTAFVSQQPHPQHHPEPMPYKHLYEIESRNKQVILPSPTLHPEEPQRSKQLRRWIAEVTNTVFSSAFHYYSKGEMNFQQSKIFCSENILKNISSLSLTSSLAAQDFETIDRHLVDKVLPYLGAKYPLTESSEVNKKLWSAVEQIDNMEELQNNYFNSSKICFELRKEGNYNDLIMRVLNDLLERIDAPTQNGKTNYQEFEQFMARTFKQVYDIDWINAVLDSNSAESAIRVGLHQQASSSSSLYLHRAMTIDSQHVAPENTQILQRNQSFKEEKERHREGRDKDRERVKEERRQMKRRREEKERYKQEVEQYTSFLIGRKVPENLPLYSEQQIAQNKITLKHPAILRILTKWFEELWKKFERNHFGNRSETIKVQKGDNTHDLTADYRQMLDNWMAEEKKKISLYISTIEKLNYKLEASLLLIEKQLGGEDQMDEHQRICGKFASKVVKNLHSEIIEYLNKVIHSILSCSERFHKEVLRSTGTSEVQKTNWPSPPNLISFKLGDLLRCKLSSKEQEVLMIYREMLRLHQDKQLEKKFRIVRIKNRLKDSTNDILINIRFNDLFLCEVQLAIKSHTSGFIKTSNAFHHYIYELQRSRFGPLSELCSIWMAFDGRAGIYEQLIAREEKAIAPKRMDCNCRQYMGQLNSEECFICNSCNHIRMHNNYILKHLKCQNCRDYFVCAKCRIFEEDFQILKNKLAMAKTEKQGSLAYRRLLKENCVRVINNDWDSFEHQLNRYGISIFIEASKIKIKNFKLLVYNGKKYLLGVRDHNQFYQIADISNEHLLREFRAKNVLIEVNEHPEILQFTDLEAIKHYVLPKLAATNYKKYKENVLLHLKSTDSHRRKLNNEDARKILMTGSPLQRQRVKNIFASDNNLKSLPFESREFPNLEWIVLSRNPIESIEGLEGFSSLKTFVMERQYQYHCPRTPEILLKFTELQSLEKLVLSNIALETIPPQFNRLKRLKYLFLEHCELSSVDRLGECHALEKINLSNNKINQLPISFKKLKKLQNLVLHQNPLQLLPEMLELGEKQEGHTDQIQLTVLDLSHCQIREVPLRFSALVNLEQFNLCNNQIHSLEEGVFKHMKNLKYLNLSHNQITRIPDLQACPRLFKLQVAYNQIEQLPQCLGKTQIEQFSFEGCPIKRIACVNWLKAVLNDGSSILQKYLYWVEKISPSNRIASQSKCYTKLLDINDPDDLRSDQQESKHSPLQDIQDLPVAAPQRIQADSQDSNNHEEESESQRVKQGKEGSQSSTYIGNFFKSIRKRVSLSTNQEDDYPESGQDQEIQSQESLIEASQEEFQLDDMQFEKQISPEVIRRYFEEREWLVFEFESKIRYSQNAAFFCKQINIYHDPSTPQIASKFLQMIVAEAIKCSIVNVYAVPLLNNFTNLQLEGMPEGQKNGILYESLRNNQMPFVYGATLLRESQVQLRGSETIQIPPYMYTDKLVKLSLYNVKEPDSRLNHCTRLQKLKVRKCKWTEAPITLAELHALQVLDLSRNGVERINGAILAGLPNLKVLLLTQNKFKEVPAVQKSTQLEVLGLSSNPIELIPECLSALSQLKVLQIDRCPLRAIYCKELVSNCLTNDEILIHLCEFSLWKAHCCQRIIYRSNFHVEKMLSCEEQEEDLQQYQQVCSVEQQKKLLQFFQSQFKENQFRQRFIEQEFIAFRFIHKTKYRHEGPKQVNMFKVMVDEEQPEVASKFRGFLQQYSLQGALMKVIYIRFTSFPRTTTNVECMFCRCRLSYPYYWLKWEYPSPSDWLSWKDQPKFGCRNCVEGYHPQKYFKYLKNSVLVLEHPATSKWPVENFGKNLQPAFVSQKARHNFECDGCGATVFELGDSRYICMGCKSSKGEERNEDLLDLCKECIRKLISKTPQLPRSLHKFNHKSWHPFLRVLFNTQGYYVY